MTLEYLRSTYGDISPAVIISYWRNYFGETAPAGNFYAPKPAAPPKNKFSPVNIATQQDWAELREAALDLHELTMFFAGRIDSQSPQFLNLIKKYREELEKKLSLPAEIDADSSLIFVEEISNTLKRRFYTILESCTFGMRGKGAMPVYYYSEIANCVRKYFERIGLKIGDVKAGSDLRAIQDYMSVTVVQTNNWYLANKIAEVSVQPHYFEYHDDDGEVQKFWIDGKCSVYKFGR